MERTDLLERLRAGLGCIGLGFAIVLTLAGINMVGEWMGFESGGMTEREYDRQLRTEVRDYEQSSRSITMNKVTSRESGCDSAYPTVCIEPLSAVGDLDCSDIEHRSFTVRNPDPHWFDQDDDGIGCEPYDD